MQKWGIDVSKWQKGFNFDKAKEEGVEFVILRGAYSTGRDLQFDNFYKKCKERNIPVGVYQYSMARTVEEAKQEANALIKILSGKQFEYPIYLDVEDKTQKELGRELLTKIIRTWCEILESSGYYVGIYSTYSYLKSYTNIDDLKAYDKWIAQWSTKCTCKIEYGMWQFGGETNKIRTNKVAGVVCDQNYAYKDYPVIVKSAGLNGYGKQSDDKKKTVDELAREVIAGKWGTGINRKNRLTQAGYDYNAVQKMVNQLM